MIEMVCIVCPNGCLLQVEGATENLTVSGARCPRGKTYAFSELTNPTRSLTTTVKTAFPDSPVLPVRTDGEIPKEKIFDAMKFINSLTINSRIKRGGIVVENIVDTGINIISTSDILIRI